MFHPQRIHAADVLRNLHVIIHRGGMLHLAGPSRRARQAQQAAACLYESAERNTSGSVHGSLHPRGGRTSFDRSSAGASSERQAIGNLQVVSRPMSGSKPSLQKQQVQQGLARPMMSQKDALTLLAMYLSAIVHDYDHRGVTNAFLIQDQDPLAVRGGEGLPQVWKDQYN